MRYINVRLTSRDGIKLNPQVYAVQQQISAKFHPNRSTFGRMTSKKTCFRPIIDDAAMSIDGARAVNNAQRRLQTV